ncbi:MAG TPA: Hsp70 family protein, partial [Candidatus Ventrisoma faecale]|nr:Hsp70 family protein [Candidatus Ventrisoma faecale]
TAAAIAYGLYERKRNTRFLVFDLGGGTFDVSILELYQNILEVRAVAGDNYLGGEDFTDVMERIFLRDHGLEEEKLDRRTLVNIHSQAEKAKLRLSDSRETEMSCKVDGEVLTTKVEYSQYERECENLLARIRKPVQRSLSDAHIKLSDIDVIVLVGGATKFQIVRDFIIKLFKKFPDTSVNPDEAVALGAAIQAAMKERNEAVKEVILTDVCSFTLGTEVVVERGRGNFESGHFCPIIDRNTVIPASRTERFYTVHDDQTKITVNVLQGESRYAANNLLLGEMTISVPKNKAGAEAVDVTYTYDINSILEVEVLVLSTGEKKKQIIKGKDNDMSDAQIEERMRELSYLKIHPRDKEENKLLLLRGERLYEESTGTSRSEIEYLLRRFEDALNSREPAKIAKAREELAQRLKDTELE